MNHFEQLLTFTTRTFFDPCARREAAFFLAVDFFFEHWTVTLPRLTLYIVDSSWVSFRARRAQAFVFERRPFLPQHRRRRCPQTVTTLHLPLWLFFAMSTLRGEVVERLARFQPTTRSNRRATPANRPD